MKDKQINSLKKLMATHYVFLLKTQHAHWNVKDPYFEVIHKFHQGLYEYAFATIDSLAERLKMKYSVAINIDLKTIESLSVLKIEKLDEENSNAIWERLRSDIAAIINELLATKEFMADDIATDDLMVTLTEQLEMFLWKMTAIKG